jgi:UDP-glucose:(heptosyl)LPS alpha-1,3-glucosyltransferase
MKVALSFPGCHRRGGVERVMLECANFLADRGHDTHIYAADFETVGLHPDVSRHPIPLNKRFRSLNLITFSRRTRRRVAQSLGQADVHSTFGIQCPHDGVLWVQSVHRAWLEISSRRRGLAGRLKQRLNPFHPIVLALEQRYYARRNYRKLIALTTQVKNDLMRLYSVPENDIVVLPNGFSPTEFNWERALAERDEVRSSLSISPDDQAVLFVANELERKGFGPLVRAIASMDSTRVKLIVVGKASLKPYESELRRLSLWERVVDVGPTNNVARYFAAADVFALPTQYEAWGLVIIEALACGVPVLTSRLAGAAIAVSEGRTGELLADPDDSAEIASKLGRLLRGGYDAPQQISESVATYAWPTVLKTYEQILIECAGKGQTA